MNGVKLVALTGSNSFYTTERILLALGIHAGEMLCCLALHGANSIGLRIYGSGELARYALMYAGVPVRHHRYCPNLKKSEFTSC